MERVILFVDRTGERLPCLLNPEGLDLTRRAGIVDLPPGIGPGGSGADAPDTPLAATGGGRTEFRLDLLFDVELALPGLAGERVDDVRTLTAPLWRLAETGGLPLETGGGPQAPELPVVRLIWGKRWNLPGVVVAAAERLERFTADGSPQRSWLRLLLRRVPAAPPRFVDPAPEPADIEDLGSSLEDEDADTVITLREGERLDDLALRVYGDPGWWRLIAGYNGLADPLATPPGTVLRLPGPRAVAKARAEENWA